MEPMTILRVPGDGWTVDELPDTDFDYELVDGTLLVTPPRHLRHDVLANELAALLGPLLDREWGTLVHGGVFFDERNFRVPDLVVYRRASAAAGRLGPRDVLLAVEVMSDSSVSNDRVTKPAQYAAAGIPHYWRVEQDPLTLITCDLAGDVYRETARFTDQVRVELPVRAIFPLRRLLGPA